MRAVPVGRPELFWTCLPTCPRPSVAPKCSESITVGITPWLPRPLDAQTPPSPNYGLWGQSSGPAEMTANTCINFVSAELWGWTTQPLKTVTISPVGRNSHS